MGSLCYIKWQVCVNCVRISILDMCDASVYVCTCVYVYQICEWVCVWKKRERERVKRKRKRDPLGSEDGEWIS